MATTRYDTLLPEVLMHAANCPEPVAVNAIRNACIELCEETLLYTQPLDAIAISANESVYPVEAPSGYDVVQVMKPLFFEGAKLVDFADMNVTAYTEWATQTGEQPLAWTCFSPGEITVYPIPTVSSSIGLTGRIALAPTSTSTGVEAWVLSDNRMALAAGALAQILDYPDQPFTNPKKAAQRALEFKVYLANKRADVNSGFMRSSLRVKFRKVW